MASQLPEQGLGWPGVQPEHLIDLYRATHHLQTVSAVSQEATASPQLATACLHNSTLTPPHQSSERRISPGAARLAGHSLGKPALLSYSTPTPHSFLITSRLHDANTPSCIGLFAEGRSLPVKPSARLSVRCKASDWRARHGQPVSLTWLPMPWRRWSFAELPSCPIDSDAVARSLSVAFCSLSQVKTKTSSRNTLLHLP